jgi:hypothetical protein
VRSCSRRGAADDPELAGYLRIDERVTTRTAWAAHVANTGRLTFGSPVTARDPNLASYLRIEERELEAGGLNGTVYRRFVCGVRP